VVLSGDGGWVGLLDPARHLYGVQVQPKPSDRLGPAVTRNGNSDGAYRHDGLSKHCKGCQMWQPSGESICLEPDNQKKASLPSGTKSIREEDL